MATVTKWNPFGVALNVTATGSTVTRTSATKYTVKINVSWESYYSGNKTNYGMTATSGGSTVTINPFGTKSASGSGTLTGTYTISGNGSQSKTITVTFRNFNNDNGDSATKTVSFNVTVPAWTSYKVTYNANGGSGAPSSQTKWKDQTLTLSSTKPTRTGYTFQGWGTSASDTTVDYAAGANYTSNAAITLYAIWKANTYTVSFNANGGSGAPSNQTKTYGVNLTLSSTKPTRTNYTFKGWGTSAGATTVAYAAGASYTANAAITLYAIWELSYVKPRITNFVVARCDSSGNVSDEGTYALVSFSWACDYAAPSITINWKLVSSSTYKNSATVTASGTSGTVSQVIGAGGISTENSYYVQVVVADSNDSSDDAKTIQSIKYPIDVKNGGKGLGFGKAAELENVADFAFLIKSTGGFEQPVLEAGSDFNNLKTPNTYTLLNFATSEYLNAPLTLSSTGTLIVRAGGRDGQIHQIVERTSKSALTVYERYFYSNAWSDWVCTFEFSGKVLWSGSYYMTSTHTITLSEAISKQQKGIVLVFSEFVDGAAKNQTFVRHFVDKATVALHAGVGCVFSMYTSNLAYFATKYLYINDATITGHDNNNLTFTGTCGITATNARFVLRYVIGV